MLLSGLYHTHAHAHTWRCTYVHAGPLRDAEGWRAERSVRVRARMQLRLWWTVSPSLSSCCTSHGVQGCMYICVCLRVCVCMSTAVGLPEPSKPPTLSLPLPPAPLHHPLVFLTCIRGSWCTWWRWCCCCCDRHSPACVCVCVCVWSHSLAKACQWWTSKDKTIQRKEVCVCVCVCVCVSAMRRSARRANAAALYEFVDSNFLNNKRPAIPGGAWPLESLRRKSLADLQGIWLSLLKERAMLSTIKEHYLKHQEELGAMPAPSRLKMVEESMENLKRVVKERDAEATAEAVRLFTERLAKGIYRYPPGPPPPPGAHDTTSTVKLMLSRHVGEVRLRELLGRFDVFEDHRGIVALTVTLPEAVLQQKREAEQLWQQYMTERQDVVEYHKWPGSGDTASVHDYAVVELAPGVYSGQSTSSSGGEGDGDGDGGDVVKAAQVPVPPPQTRPPLPRSPLEHIRYKQRSALSKAVIQLGYFPNITSVAPRYATPEEVPRPTHPDEIAGPWEVRVTYDSTDGLAYVQSMDLTSIDGAVVLSVEADPAAAPQPFAAVDPVYQEAVRCEMAQEATLMKWPHVPEWKNEYDLYTRKSLDKIVQYNYSNVVDYVDREVLLTGRSVWESPIDVDPTCGGMRSVPSHAKKPRRYMAYGLDQVGVTDI
ncbi:Mitochondrial 39-S ribosomal protein L47 (MRP-L47) [Novymonas esmeraldas]|uniref:Large ribosomal subunit protein uL29m n=1 Tax=Novymonas esmeraldas TaxID=1808958 RepID=A0AAW0EXV9_9TRYP